MIVLVGIMRLNCHPRWHGRCHENRAELRGSKGWWQSHVVASNRKRLMFPVRKAMRPATTKASATHSAVSRGFAPMTGQGSALRIAVNGTPAFKLRKQSRAEP
mmetsp:Transcript_91581/g.191438  ORF Transcript_91581/g.191438 Transcript_91581/m.191438 type:complete len:103 (+) Transcript_91581:175-483(+)